LLPRKSNPQTLTVSIRPTGVNPRQSRPTVPPKTHTRLQSRNASGLTVGSGAGWHLVGYGNARFGARRSKSCAAAFSLKESLAGALGIFPAGRLVKAGSGCRGLRSACLIAAIGYQGPTGSFGMIIFKVGTRSGPEAVFDQGCGDRQKSIQKSSSKEQFRSPQSRDLKFSCISFGRASGLPRNRVCSHNWASPVASYS
jgi:hypothetical protein